MDSDTTRRIFARAPAEIVEAIRARGWLPDQIEALRIAQADDLQRVPLCENLRAGAERIRTAPVATPQALI